MISIIGKDYVTVRNYTNIKQEERIIDTYGPTKKQFQWPWLLAKGPHGKLIVFNNSEDARHIVIFDENLQYLRVIGAGKGIGNGKFRRICGMTVDEVGFLYVTDGKLNCIQNFYMA